MISREDLGPPPDEVDPVDVRVARADMFRGGDLAVGYFDEQPGGRWKPTACVGKARFRAVPAPHPHHRDVFTLDGMLFQWMAHDLAPIAPPAAPAPCPGSLSELRATAETVYPLGLADLLTGVLAHGAPRRPASWPDEPSPRCAEKSRLRASPGTARPTIPSRRQPYSVTSAVSCGTGPLATGSSTFTGGSLARSLPQLLLRPASIPLSPGRSPTRSGDPPWRQHRS
ncbi:hypothetical protein JCM4814A_00850 [Streptomyces phaeofaciens JCM 4814]|uniref:Uncharacterized protein n=1 Tax=Streptomyces phaeofaciens TaxID=68254 RepID=A0A918M1E0_9ACTN|nr:hypothetical protein GCM10010226_82730 [Streptomyces phaeofaciens]